MFKSYHRAIVWTFVVSLVCSPAIANAQPPGESGETIAARKPDLDYITPKACAAVVLYPRSVLKSARPDYLPVEMLSVAVKQQMGIDPVDIEQLIIVIEPTKTPPPELAFVLKLASPLTGDILPALAQHTTESTLDGKAYRKAKTASDASVYQADERTLIVGSDTMLRKVVANHAAPAESYLKTMLGRCGTPDALVMVLVEPLRPALAELENAPLPPPLDGIRAVPKLIDYIAFKANVCDSLDATLTLKATDEAAAKQLGGIIDGLMAFAQQAADAKIAKQETSPNLIEQAAAKYSKRISRRMAELLRPVQKGALLTIRISQELLFPAPSAEALAGLAAKKPDLTYIPADAAAAAILYPQSMLKRSPLAEYLPLEIMSAAGKQFLGLDPVEIEQAIAVAELSASGQPGGAVVLKMAQPVAGNQALPMLAGMTEEGTLDGKAYRKGKAELNPSIYQADERTLIVGTDAMLRKVVAAHAAPAESKLKTMLGHCGTPDMLLLVLSEPLQPALAGMAQGPMGPAVGNAANVLKQVNYVAYKANFYDPIELTAVVRGKDDSAAEQLENMLKGAMAMQQQTTAAALGQVLQGRDPMEQAFMKYVKRLLTASSAAATVSRQGSTVTVSGLERSAGAGVAVGMLLPAVQAAREAARRTQSANNVKQIMLGMLNYEQTKGSLPPQAICDGQGKPLLSWRVAILPYIEEDALYKQFHLDEPWDSPNNRPLIARMPKVFQNPSSRTAKPGMANYLAVCGTGLLFDGTKARKMSEITDGTSRTIAVVEADDDRAVEWTKPQDWDFDARKPLSGLGHAHPAGFTVAFVDGSVHFLSATIDPVLFRTLLTVAGGENVQLP